MKARHKKKEKRQLKIYPKHLPRSGGTILVPEIRLCGSWLAEIHFKPGETITVVCEDNKIIITNKEGVPAGKAAKPPNEYVQMEFSFTLL